MEKIEPVIVQKYEFEISVLSRLEAFLASLVYQNSQEWRKLIIFKNNFRHLTESVKWELGDKNKAKKLRRKKAFFVIYRI